MTGAPVLLVTSSYRGRHNALPVAYAMVLSIVPPLIGIAIHPSRYSYDVIRKTEEFAINIPTRELLHHVQYLGTLSGLDFDKLELTKLPSFRARKLDTILLEGCVGWIECSVQDAIEMGDHFLLVGRVVAVSADDDAFDGSWKLESGDMKPLHYLGANHYAVLDYVMDARIPKSAEEYGKRLDEAVQVQRRGSKGRAQRRGEVGDAREQVRKGEG